MPVVVLHLSDIHIRNAKDPILSRAKSIAACCYAHLPEAKALIMMVSGDIVYDGLLDEYELAQKFVRELVDEIHKEKRLPVHLVFCPGNHDCDFERNTKIRELALEALRQHGTDAVDDSVIAACCTVQSAYFNFIEQLNAHYKSPEGDRLWQTLRLEVDGKDVVVDCINVAWMSRIREEQGSLSFPYDRYIKETKDKPDVRIAVMHHPFHWLSQRIYQPFRKALREREHIIFTGHEHIGNFGENTDTESGESAYVEGCVLQDDKDFNNSAFNIVVIDLDRGLYKAVRYQWATKIYELDEEGSWEDYRAIPVKAANAFEVQRDFRALITDPGRGFEKLSGHQINLADIFVFPDLITAGEKETDKRVSSSQILTDASRIAGGVLLEAEERVGATTLLYQLFERYHEQGLVPLYLDGGNLGGATPKDVETWIRRAVEEQYGSSAFVRYQQVEKAKRILLLDDFNNCDVPTAALKARVVELLAARFECFVAVVGELFDLQQVVAGLPHSVRDRVQHFRILPFGYALRAKLARKWFQLGARDGSMHEDAILDRCHQAEKLMDTAMGKNIVPSVPIYLLTLLQSIDAGLSHTLQDSGLGSYYAFLINENLKSGGIAPSKWDELTEYAADLAWHFHTNGRELSRESLTQFNEQFSKDRYAVAFDKRLEELVAGRILIQAGEHFRFRHHYSYYLLKGRYITRNLSSSNIQTYLDRCCQHLYVRENANTILFMAHHQAGQSMVMDKIIERLGHLFSEKLPLQLQSDTGNVEQLIRELPKLEYSGEDPERLREKVREIQDQDKEHHDGLADGEEEGPALSIVAEVVTTFKTVEILGQLLQNQFAALPRARREDVLDRLFRGPLRALAGYYEFLTKTPESIIAEVDAALRDRAKIEDPAKRQQIARELVALVVQITALGFVQKAASSVSSEALLDDVRGVAKKNGTTAYKLIRLATELDTLKRLPKDLIEELIEETEGRVLANRTLQLLVLRHLYMFRTTEMDRQWLSSKKVVGIKTQKSIDVKTSRVKKLKKK
jgi:hypothetical protein